MERKAKSNPKLTFLESIPSQLRYAYLALKKKQEEKAADVRDRDSDLQDVISGHNFGYLSFEKMCKNVFEPEDCFLRFDAVSCKLIMQMSLSEEMFEFQLFQLSRPSSQFETVNKRNRNIDNGLILCVNVITDDESGSNKVLPMHFVAQDSHIVMTWRHALSITLAEAMPPAGYHVSEWGQSFLWRVWRTVPAPEISLHDHLFVQATSEDVEVVVQASQLVEFGPENMTAADRRLSTTTHTDGSPISKLFDNVVYRDSRARSESLSFLELLSSVNPKEVRQLQMLQQSGINSEIDLTLTTACAAGLWDDAYGMAINPRTSPFEGIRADGNTALHFVCNQDPKCSNNSLGNGSIYEKLLRVLLEKGGESVINAPNRQGVTPLMIATSWSNEVLVKLLISLSADFTAEDVMGNTPFHYAVCFGSPTLLAILCSKVGRLRRSSYFEGLPTPQTTNRAKARLTKLQAVISFKAIGTLQAPEENPSDLHSFSRSISSLNSSGHSCLHLAIARRDTEYLCKVLDILSDFGLHSRLLCASDHRGETPLHFACRVGSIEDIMVLLFHGSRVGAMSDDGSTSESLLRGYVSRNKQETKVLKLVIMLGDVIEREDSAYELFLEQKQEKNASATLMGSQVEFCQILRKKRQIGIGMPSLMSMLALMPSLVSYCPNLVTSCDWIMKLVEDGDAEKLIKHIADIGETIASCLDLTDSHGNTLLHKAVEFKHFDIVAILLDAGIDASKENLSGITAVHIAASIGVADIYFFLVSSLLNVEVLFESKANIMHFAASGGCVNILDSLHCNGGLLSDETGNSNGALEEAMLHRKFATSVYIACHLPFPSWQQAIILEVKDFVSNLEKHRSDWHNFMDESQSSEVYSELEATIVDATGPMVARSLTSNDGSALWRHASAELWQSLSNWQSRDEQRHYMVHLAVINRRYQALHAMLSNGHSPAAVDGKFRNPIYYACLRGDWRLVAVLRVCYLAPFGVEEVRGGFELFDDSLLTAAIEHDNIHVLMTLMLLNVPFSKHNQDIIVNSEQNCEDLFPSSVVRSFEMQKSRTFHLLISICFTHSIKVHDGMFQSILMNLKREYIVDKEFEKALGTETVIRRFTQAIDAMIIQNHVTPAAQILTESTIPNAEDIGFPIVRRSTAMNEDSQNNDITMTYTESVLRDATLKSEDRLSPSSKQAVNPNSANCSEYSSEAILMENENYDMITNSHSVIDHVVDSVSVGLDSKLTASEQSTSTIERDLETNASSLKNALFCGCSVETGAREEPEDAKIHPRSKSPVLKSDADEGSAIFSIDATDESVPLQISDEIIQASKNSSLTSNQIGEHDMPVKITNGLSSSPVLRASDEHYRAKESLIITFDRFELDVDPENRNAEPAIAFQVQDVLPAVHVEDHIGNSFLNACKQGLDEVLISLVDGFSVESIFRSLSVAQGNPLHLAVQARSLSTIDILLKWRPTLVFEVDKDGGTPLHAACKINFHVALNKFLNSALSVTGILKSLDRDGNSCLTLAVKQGASECVELLARNEDDVMNSPSTSVPSALELSLTSPLYSVNTFMRLFNICSEQVLSNFRSSHDNGLLQVAVKYQRIHSVCAILRRMGDGSAQIRDATGRTAVEIASASSDKTIFNLLVKPPEAIAEPAHQPSLDVAERTFDSCFCEADLSKNYLLRSFPGGIQVTSGLIDRIHSCVIGETKGSGLLHLFQKMVSSGNAHLLGMPVFEFGPQKQCTCLHLAAGVNSLVCLQFILDNCSRSRQFIDLHNSDGMTACGVALTGGYTKCAMMLLMQGSRIVSKSASGTSTDSMKPKICNLLHICAKHCHDPTMMEHLLDASTTSNIFCLNESNQTLLHICAHVNNIHAFNAISTKVPYAICILINHRDDLGNTALHICSSSAGSLPLAQALIQSGCYTHLRNYDGDLPCDIASFMGNMDIAQLTRTFKCEELEFERRSDFRLLCDEHETKLVDLISHGKATDISTMCKSPFWMGSWLSFDFMTSLVCAEKAAEFKTAVALSNSGFCALTCPALVETLLEIMLKTRQMSITKSLDAILVGCSAEPSISTVSSFMSNNFPTFVHRIASDKTLEDVIYAWVVRYWTRLSVCDANGYNSIELACKSENIGFLNAIISQLEALKSNADTKSNRDAQMFCCMKNELFKALSSQTQKYRPFLDTISNTLVGNVVMKIASLISYKILLRNAPASQILECDLINQRHSTLVSFGMVDELFREAGFDVEMAQNLRDSFGRCLVTIACIAGKVASVAALLEKGFSTSVVDCKGLNILHHTVANHKNDVVYYIVQRFPLMLLELDSAGCCLLHHAVCNGTDDDCLSTLTLIRKIADNDVFMQLCIHADDSNTTAIEASFARGNYNSGTYLLQNVLVICGRFAANPIHIFDSFVKRYLTRTFKLISDFNALLGKFSVQASVQNSLMSFVNVFCPELPFPVEDDDVLQPQNVDSASQSLKTMESGLKSSSFFSGQWVCIEETFSEHFLVPNDTSLTKASLAQIFSSVYDDTAFSNYVRPSVSEALIAHSLRLNWILQDGVSLSDCEQAMSIHTELIRHFLILELLSSAFCYNIQAFCRHAHSQLRCPANLEQHKIEKNPTVSSPGNKISTVSAPAALELAIDSQMLNAVGIYPPISSLPETAELFEMVSMNRIEDIFSCITKSSKYLTMYLDVHKNTLAHAVAFFCCVQDVEKLIIAGLKFNVRNDSGQMPFHFACMAGRFEVAQACLRSFGFQKSDQIPVDSYGNSILHFAALSLNEHCLSSVQQTYQIPWDLATTSQRQTALDLLLQMEVDPKQRVCGLLVKGEALAEACKSKLVSVQFALQSSLVTCCRLDSYAKAVCCVHAGADIRTYFALDADNGEHNFWNAIDVCAAYNSVSVMKNIFENVENSVWMEAVKRINCNRRKNQQPAPLWVACKHSSLNALKFLLENGSNLLDENDAGLNIFSYCITTRCNEALLELLNFSSAFFSDLFLKNIILTADKTGLSCVECAIQARYPEPIRVIRQHLIATKACNEPDMIILGHKYITYLCQSRCILPSDPNSTFSCLMEIVYFFDEDAVQALMKMYQYDCHPLKSCSSAGAHDTAILVFILHVLARVDFNGQKLLHTDLDEPLDSMTILPRSGSTTIWNAFQLIERILPAFIGHEAWIQRYLSGHLGRFVVKLDDYCVDQFLKLLLSRNESVITSRDLWESFFSRARSSFNHICIRDTPIIEPYSSTNLTSEQNKLLDAIHRGDSLALNKIVSENPGVYLDPAQCGEFHNQCYVAAIVGDQEHMLDKLAQKGFQYSQQYGKENLIILASRLGRSKIIKSLSLMPHLNLDINHCTSDGMNALRVACARNHCETVQSLIINFPSIDVSAQNSLGESAVSLCIRHGHASALAIIIKCVGIQMFLSVVNENKQNVFHLAAVADNSSVFQVVCAVILKELDQTHVFGGKHPSQELLKSLVEVSRCAARPEANDILFAALCAQDVNGDTPAHICIHSRSVAVLAVLLHACPIACLMPNASGSSPLHVVASRSCFSVDLFRLLVSAAKSLGQWIFDYQSRQQLLAENYGAQASLMAALCHFENVDGLTVWDVAFSENNDAQSYITKFISLCRMKNPQMPQISQLIGSSILKTLFSDITAPSTYKRVPQKTRMGSIYLASIYFLQNILRRSKLNRWYVMQIHRRIYEVKRRLVSSCLLQRNWRHHVSSQKMRAAKYFKMCCVRIQCCYRSMLCRRIFTLRKNLSHQVVRIERSRSIWTAYQRFVKRKSSVNIFQSIQEINAEYRHRCSISGALQLQAAVMSHHIYLLRKHHRKRTCIKSEFYAARTIQKVFRGREGRRLFSSLQQLSDQENFLTLPSGRKLHVQKYMMLHFIRRMQRAVRFLLAKRQVSVEYFSKNGLSACCIIQRAWFNHFCRVILRRSQVKQRESVLSAFACKIQKHIRGKLSRSSFMKSIEVFCWSKSAITLQCAFRCTLALHIFRLRADRASFDAQRIRKIQDLRVFIENESLKSKRGRVESQLLLLKGKAATVISSLIRGVILRCRKVLPLKRLERQSYELHRSKVRSAEKIQRAWFKHCALKTMHYLGWNFGANIQRLVAIRRIVSHLKIRTACTKYHAMRRYVAVVKLQNIWRIHQSHQQCQKIRFRLWKQQIHSHATKIKAVFIAHKVRLSFCSLKSKWPTMRETRISKKVLRQLFSNFQSSKFHKIVLKSLLTHKNMNVLMIQCAFRSKLARNTFRSVVSCHNMNIIEKRTRTLQRFWRRCLQEKLLCSKIPWMLFPWPSSDVHLEASSWSVSHAYDVRLESFMQSRQFDDYDKTLSAACQFGMRRLQEVPDEAAHALQSLVRFAASMSETALYHGNKDVAFSLASRAAKLLGTEKTKFVLNCRTELSAWVLDTLAHVFFSRGLFSHTLSLLNEAIISGGLRSSPDNSMLAILHFHKGLVYLKLGNTLSAKDNLLRACQMFRQHGDENYSLHLAAAQLALSSSLLPYDMGAAANHSFSAKDILSQFPTSDVHETFFPPSMCWRQTGLQRILRRIAMASGRFIRSALLKFKRSTIQTAGTALAHFGKSRPRRFFNRSHLFPQENESWARWSIQSVGAFGIIPEIPKIIMIENKNSHIYETRHRHILLDSGRFREKAVRKDNKRDELSAEQTGDMHSKLNKYFADLRTTPVLIHPFHAYETSTSNNSAFQDIQFLLSSCLDVKASPSSQQRWLKLLQSSSPDGQLPSFVRDLVTHAPIAAPQIQDSTSSTVKQFCASPNPTPRKDIVSCLDRVMLYLLQRAHSLWASSDDERCSIDECKESVQLLKDMIDGTMNSLKHVLSKNWKYAIILCDAVLLALSSDYSEAFNHCMRVHDSLQKAQGIEERELYLRLLSSCNAVYCLWHFQNLATAEVSQNTTIALSELLYVDVKLAMKIGLTSVIISVSMFHNLAHIKVQTGEYLRAFSAWEEVHKAFETMSQQKTKYVQENPQSLTTRNSSLLKASLASIEDAISKWMSIKNILSSEYRISTGIQGIRDIKQSHQSQRTTKKKKEDTINELSELDEKRHKMTLSPNVIQQTLPEELFLGLFGSGAGRVRAAVLPKEGSQ